MKGAFSSLLVVCTGNVCRSPMAEALFRDRFPGGDFVVESAGLGAREGSPAPDAAINVMRERGLEIGEHRSRQLDEPLARQYELLLVMEAGQREWIEAEWPPLRGRAWRLGHWLGTDIPDPWRRPEAAFRESRDLIEEAVESWVERLAPR